MNLLITGAWSGGKNCISELEKIGHSVCFMQFEKDKLPCEYSWAEGVVCNGLFLTHPIERFKNLRYIQLTSAGFDRVDMDYVKAHKIEIHNARGVYSIPMAEFAICGVLQIYKQAVFFRENQKQHLWEKHRGLLELANKKVLIVGCGSVGDACARRFKAFECEIVGIDLFPKENDLYNKMLPLDMFDKALQLADIVVLTLPLTERTHHLMNDYRLSLMKDGAILVNIARGAIVDIQALLNCINRFAGAVLDVFEEEPIDESSRIWDCKDIIVTPHNSFVSDQNLNRLSRIIISNIGAIAI